MNIREKEEYIEKLRNDIDSISYPDNPLKEYSLSKIELSDCCSGIANEEKEKKEFVEAFNIAIRMTSDIIGK